MPEQPQDPIDYEMKIPPETEHSKHDQEPQKPPPDNQSSSDKAKDVNVVRGDDKPQSVRHPAW